MRQPHSDIFLIFLSVIIYLLLVFARQHHVYLPLVLAPAPEAVIGTPVVATREP